jgi:NADH-quinone oxidoreductase subunit F
MVRDLTPSPQLTEFLENNGSRGREMLLPALLMTQKIHDYIPEEAAAAIGQSLKVPLADIYGVIEFYSMLSSQPRAETSIRICTTPSCASQGSGDLVQEVCQHLGVDIGESTVDGRYIVEEVECLGLCDHAPGVLVGSEMVGNANLERIFNPEVHPRSQIYAEEHHLTARTGRIDPLDTGEFIINGGFTGLKSVLRMTPDEVIEAVTESGLTGRGGAGFPTGIKWAGCAEVERFPKYLVCNEDESEPGTFKDRALIEGDPFTIIEGMLIAAYAVGAEKGYLYIRGEYTKSHHTIQKALEIAHKEGFLGEKILGSDFSFEIELRSGAGAYICGEETALFESIEGKRGFPRVKPPFPTTHGLFNQPTVINNVETLANVSLIFGLGVGEYRKLGSERSPGPRLFSLSGDIERPGIYEISQPISLRELIYGKAGGIKDGKECKAVLLGGAAGKFVGPDQLDVILTPEDTKEADLSLGSGAVVVFDEDVDLRFVLHGLGHFFAYESCGKCYPCQLGTQRQAEILDRFMRDQALPGDLERLQDVRETMTTTSLCGLGQTASLAVLSAIELCPEYFDCKEMTNGK